jgi:hypothetical protein
MGVYKMNRRNILIAFVCVLLAAILLASLRHDSGTKTQEPEQGGTALVQLSNTERLNAYLTPDQFTEIKDNISTYILGQVNKSDQSASITETDLAPDGTITLQIKPSSGQSFTALVSRTQNVSETIFQVPATSYSVTNDLSDSTNE